MKVRELIEIMMDHRVDLDSQVSILAGETRHQHEIKGLIINPDGSVMVMTS